MPPQIILASASPRRKELLNQIKVSATVYPVEIDESPLPNEQPQAYVERLAAEKSAFCANKLSTDMPILAADTTVVIDNQILGKPKGRDDCVAMLSSLSGRMHRVYTAISLRGAQHWQALSVTEVTFRLITQAEIIAYWQTNEPTDKAGGYAIQGLGGIFVESINGSYSGVMGLPLYETAQLLAKQGFDLMR